MSEIIRFDNVVKTFGQGEGLQVAVDHVSFSIEEGEFVVILGQSGAGKSTVLNMLGGLDTPTEGKIWVNDREISSLTDRELSRYRADTIGFIFQFYNLLPTLTAFENVALTKDILPGSLGADEMLEKVGLASCRDRFPSQLSGGEQQRVSIARALAKQTPILLGDEPTGALDSETGLIVLQLLSDICREQKRTVIIVTHNADIARCADRVIRMRNGQVREVKINADPIPVREIVW